MNNNKHLNLHDVLSAIDGLCYSGKLDDAVVLYHQAAPLLPNNASLEKRIANHLIQADHYDQALSILQKSSRIETDAELTILLGFCLKGLGRIAEAESACMRAQSLLTEADASVIHLHGLLSYDCGDKQDAAVSFQRAIELDPTYGQAYADLGLLKIDAGKAEEGFELLKEGFKRSPEISALATCFHQAVCEMRAFQIAEPLFQQGLIKFPQHKKLHYLYIDMLIQQGKFDPAMAAIEKAIYLFGISDGILEPALRIRGQVGPMEIADRKNGSNTMSLCMIVKNEARHLARCLYNTKPIVDEIIIVDTGSSDSTVDIATSFGAKVHHHQWRDDFSDARNVSLRHANGSWILILDADEIISPSDHKLILKKIQSSSQHGQGFYFETRNYTDDVGLEGWRQNDGVYKDEQAGMGWCPSRKVRLFSNHDSIRFVNPVHELVEPSLRAIGFMIADCEIPVHHYGKLEQKQDRRKKKDYFRLGLGKIRKKKGDIYALMELAIQAGEVGEFQKAIDLWHEILNHTPDLPQAYFNLSYAYIQLEQYQSGAKAARRAATLDPTLKEARLNDALCQIRLGYPIEASRILEGFLQEYAGNPMAMGLLAVSCCLLDQSEKAVSLLRKLENLAFDCSGYLLEHAKKLLSAGREGDAQTLVDAIKDSPYSTSELEAVGRRPINYEVSQEPLKIKRFDINDNSITMCDLYDPLAELDLIEWHRMQLITDTKGAHFVLFPYPLDRLYQHLGHEETIKYLKSLPGFEKDEDRFIFFFKDDIGTALGLRSIIYRVNHNLNSMDVNSITLPYFFNDVFREPIKTEMMYDVNFVGALVTHVFRAYMMLPFIEPQQLPTYDRVLKLLDRLLVERKDEKAFAYIVRKAAAYANRIFPLKKCELGVRYYLNIIFDQYPRLPATTQERMKNELFTIMNQSIATLCPRGFGTQSIRFFETMASGRIPFVISDRYIFPLGDKIDYDQFSLRIKEHRIGRLPSEIAGFFDRVTTEEIQHMGRLARETWLEYFAPSQFEKFMYLTLSRVLEKKRCLNGAP